MSLPSVLIRKSTGEIIKRSNYPREDMQPIVGLDPDLKWLIERELFKEPTYDSRIYVLTKNEKITTTPDEEYPHLDKFEITYSTDKRDDNEIKLSIENAERNANEQLLPFEKQMKLLLLGVGVLFRKIEGMQLNKKEQAIADEITNTSVQMWKNDQTTIDKKQEIDDEKEPNIDDGWEKKVIKVIN